MAYSQSLAERIRGIVARRRGITEKKMFGGVGFLLNGNMLVGVWKTSLIVRLGPNGYEEALQEPNVGEFDITGKPMKGWVMVEPDGIERDEHLSHWIERAFDFVTALPKK
jgi:TfoX/Sxy family transcriptional regulator of competence genes